MSKTFFSNRESMYHYAASADYEGEYIRSANSHVIGGDIYSYSTKVAEFDKKKEMILMTNHFYSHTTSNTMWDIRRAFDHFTKLKVYDFTLKDAWNRLKGEVKIHTKNPATRRTDRDYFIQTFESYNNLVQWFGKNDPKVKSGIYTKAFDIVNDYKKKIAEKEQRVAERAAKRREEEERKRKERIDRTMAIIREVDPTFDEEPKTFRECYAGKTVKIDMNWLREHHPELIDEENGNGFKLYMLEGVHRHYNYEKHEYEDCFYFSRERGACKLLRNIIRWGGVYGSTPDILIYNKEQKYLYTSQHCEVNDESGMVQRLLGMFLQAVDAGKDVSFVIGKHCGPYEIREYNAAEKFLRVGCHCFLLENLREVYNDMIGG